MAAYESWTAHLYGKGLLFGAVHFAGEARAAGRLFPKILTGFAFTGGCAFFPLAALPLLFGKRTIGFALLAIALFALLLASMKRLGAFETTGIVKWIVVAHLAVLAAGGLLIFALALLDFRSRRTPEALLLLLWIAGVFLFATMLNWTISGRNFLPLAPAVALLVLRRMEQRHPPPANNPFAWLLLPLALTAALALALTWADTKAASAAKQAAQTVARRFGSQIATVRFQGHWGFQFYMQQIGAQPLNADSPPLRSGQIIVVSNNRLQPISFPPHFVQFLESYHVNKPLWLSVFDFPCSGFYSDSWGLSPFILGLGRPDDYDVFKVN